MGEFRCWIEAKDNPEMSPEELAAFQKTLDPLNAETVDKINNDWNHNQGANKAKWR